MFLFLQKLKSLIYKDIFSKLWQKVLGMDLDIDLFPPEPVPLEIA